MKVVERVVCVGGFVVLGWVFADAFLTCPLCRLDRERAARSELIKRHGRHMSKATGETV